MMLGDYKIVVFFLPRRVVVQREKFRGIEKNRDLRDLVLCLRGHERGPLSMKLEDLVVIPGGILASKAVDLVVLSASPFSQPLQIVKKII